MQKRIGIIGGDSRNDELEKLLKEKKLEVKKYDETFNDIEGFLKDVEYVISGIPFSRDDKTLNAPNILEEINIEEFFKKLGKDKIIIAGSFSDNVKKLAAEYEIKLYDFLEDEDFAIYNAIPTAEGALEVAIRERKSTINSSNCLILGYGRIGKTLADILKGLHAKVTVAARKDYDFAWIKAYGYNYIQYSKLKEILPSIDILFNTVPKQIIKEELKYMKKDSLLVELASKPGGIDLKEAKELGLKTEIALGLPGKVAPKSVAEYMLNKVLKVI